VRAERVRASVNRPLNQGQTSVGVNYFRKSVVNMPDFGIPTSLSDVDARLILNASC
jgi:hypothetical protein